MRKVMMKPKYGGTDCPSLAERQSCNLSPCTDEKVGDLKGYKLSTSQ